MKPLDFLLQISKPARYVGGELNAVHKDWDGVRFRMALAYPDLYEVGMSNLAIKILYGVLNNRADMLAERVFNPWLDAEQKMRENKVSLYGLESGQPLRRFDALGFTLPYELCYTNILNMLNLAGIPFLSAERDESYPLIIGGGPGAFNPEPLADFFDLFVLGDGEDAILEVADLAIVAKGEGWPRERLLRKMAEICGVYVPSHFQVEYQPDGRIREIIRKFRPDSAGESPNKSTQPHHIEKRVVSNLDQTFYPTKPVVSYIEAVHDRFALEIARGCSRGCRFCQAGFLYRPVRERSPENLRTLAREFIRHTGYEELSLVSLSSSDYTGLEPLLKLLRHDCQSRMMALSLPSLRPGTISPFIISYLKQIRKTGFTIAPEAGTQRLRDVINKGISEEDIFCTAQQIFGQGWELLKLYFMIGLPTEQPEDIDGIVRICREILKLGRGVNKRRININLTVSPFVPKPHTPFQRMPQERPEVLLEKEQMLSWQLNHRAFKVKCRDPQVSCLEGALARGDRRLSRVVIRAWELGSRFDQWSEQFNFSIWEQAFAENNLDLSFYAHRSIGEKEILPWEHLSSSISSRFLAAEAGRAIKGELTPDCRASICHGCGACQPSQRIEIPPLPNLEEQPIDQEEEITPGLWRPAKKLLGEKVCQIRAKFQKKGLAIYMSHLDLIRLFSRAVRRADLPIAFSQGFHPHPQISFGPSLPLGVEGLEEYADFVFRESIEPQEFLARFNAQLPEGIAVLQAKRILVQARSLSSLINRAVYQVSIPHKAWNNGGNIDHSHELNSFLARDEVWIQKSKKMAKKTKQVNIRPLIFDITLLHDSEQGEQNVFRMLLSVGQQNVNPQQVLEAIYKSSLNLSISSVKIVREGLYAFSSHRLWEPIDID